MTTLPYQEIKKLIEQKKLIQETDTDKCLGPASYELRIGSAMSLNDRIEHNIAIGQEFALKPESHILIGSIESINMPNDLCADMHLKSSFGRSGFIPWSQGYVDPGYSGKLTISLINMSPSPVILSGGQAICHIIFRSLKSATAKPYSGEYNKSKGATGPKEAPMLVIGASLRGAMSAVAGGAAGGLVRSLLTD